MFDKGVESSSTWMKRSHHVTLIIAYYYSFLFYGSYYNLLLGLIYQLNFLMYVSLVDTELTHGEPMGILEWDHLWIVLCDCALS